MYVYSCGTINIFYISFWLKAQVCKEFDLRTRLGIRPEDLSQFTTNSRAGLVDKNGDTILLRRRYSRFPQPERGSSDPNQSSPKRNDWRVSTRRGFGPRPVASGASGDSTCHASTSAPEGRHGGVL